MAVVHEQDLRPMDADEPVDDEGFVYRPDNIKQSDVSTLAGAAEQMVYQLTIITRALQEGSAPEPWDETALVRARLEATMGIAWASQCLDPHPDVASEKLREMYLEDLTARVETIQDRGIIGTIASDIFQTRQLVEEAADHEPAMVMLLRACTPSVGRQRRLGDSQLDPRPTKSRLLGTVTAGLVVQCVLQANRRH